MKAFRTWIKSWAPIGRMLAKDQRGIHWCSSVGAAKGQCFRSAIDANYEVKFTDIVVRRAPEFDNLDEKKLPCSRPAVSSRSAGMSEKYAMDTLSWTSCGCTICHNAIKEK